MNEKLPSQEIGDLEVKIPLVLGGMSVGLTGAKLAGEVANAGGLGTVGGVGWGMGEDIRTPTEYSKANQANLRQEILKALEISNGGNVGVNLMVATNDYEESVKTAVESGARFIATGAGLALITPSLVEKYRVPKQNTPELFPIVSSLRAATLILRKWANLKPPAVPTAFIVETPNDAGGHLGVTNVDDIGKKAYSLETVIPQLVEYLDSHGYDIPVIAAGGIWDRDDVNRMLSPKIGAKLVQMSTRFLPVEETNASQEFKDRHASGDGNIVIIKSPVGMPGLVRKNEFKNRVDAGEDINLGTCVDCLRVCAHRESVRAAGSVRRTKR